MDDCLGTADHPTPMYFRTQLVSKGWRGQVEVDTFAWIQPKLTPPTDEQTLSALVQQAKDSYVVLWSGTTNAACTKMLIGGSVSGAVNPDVKAPTETEAKERMALGVSCAEFTTAPGVAEGLSLGRYLVVVRINARYLTRGHASGGGWVCHPDAPLVILECVNRTCGFKEREVLGAS